MRHVSIRVAGRVQGVFFRASTKQQADELGIKGFVRNEPDGCVYLEAEGQHEAIEHLIDWCRMGGPPRGKVEELEVQEIAGGSYSDFRIIR
jgi:acylphosphatase